MKEQYTPSQEETWKAESMMTPEQRQQSNLRELREMGEKDYYQKSFNLAKNIASQVKECIGKVVEKYAESEGKSLNRRTYENILKTAKGIEDFKCEEVMPEDLVILDQDFDPAYPLTIKGYSRDADNQLRSHECPVHWAVKGRTYNSPVRLSKEDQEFIYLMYTKQALEETIGEYKKSKEKLKEFDMNMDDPKIFSEK